MPESGLRVDLLDAAARTGSAHTYRCLGPANRAAANHRAANGPYRRLSSLFVVQLTTHRRDVSPDVSCVMAQTSAGFTVLVSTRPWPLPGVVSAAGTCGQGRDRSCRCRLGSLPMAIRMSCAPRPVR